MVWDQDYATQWGRQYGYLQPGEIATGGLLNSRVAAAGSDAQAKYQAAMNAANAGQNDFAGGVNPISIEPLNQWQRESLTSLSQPITAGADTLLQALAKTGDINSFLTRGTAPMTAEQFRSGVQMYADPWTQDVIDTTNKDTQRQGDIERARIIAATRGEDSSSAGVQLAENAKNTNDAIARNTAALRSTGFNNAANLTKDFYDTYSRNNLTAASTATQIPQLLSQIGQTQRGNAVSDIQNKLNAGDRVQGQNQKVLDTVTGQYKDMNAYELEMLKQLAEILRMTPTAGGQTGYSTESNTASNIADLLAAGSKVNWGEVFK